MPLATSAPVSSAAYGGTALELLSQTLPNSTFAGANDHWSTPNISNTPNLSYEECEQLFTNFTHENSLVFDGLSVTCVVFTWIIFLLSAAGNSFVLASVTVRRPSRSHTHSQIMMAHLTVANLAFTLFLIPMDAIWLTTLQWYGGDFLCRLTNVLKQFSMYSSSAMVVVMSFDRVANLMCPVSRPRQRKRIILMLGVAWGFSFVNAIPAGFIFQLMSHPVNESCPDHFVVQCVDLSVPPIRRNLRAYYIYTMVISFFGPLVCILVCYALILLAISKMARISKEVQKRSLNHTSGSKRGLDRARRISLTVTALISATLIICWGPYYVTGLIDWFDASHAAEISKMARGLMVMSVYLNPMLHPLITIWLIKEIRDNITLQFKKKSQGACNSKSPTKRTVPQERANTNGNAGHALLPKNTNCNSKTNEVWL